MKLSKSTEINILVFAIVLFIQRMAFPFTNYLFIPYTLIVFLYFFIKYTALQEKLSLLKKIIRNFLPFIFISGFLIQALIFSDHLNILVIKDIIMMVLIFIFLIIEIIELSNLDYYKIFIYSFKVQIVLTSSLISILGLLKFLITLSGRSFSLSDNYYFNTSLSSDYNFYCLSGIFGIISILSLLFSKERTRKTDCIMQFLLFLISLNIAFSNSRRGLVFYLLFLLFIILLNISFISKPKYSYLNLRLLLYLKTAFFAFLIFFFSTYNSRLFFSFKRSSLNVNFVDATFFNLNRLVSAFDIPGDVVEDAIPIKRDPKYPYTRWGTRNHIEVFPLEGKNVEIVPSGTVGYRLDRKCNANSWNGNAYAYTLINSLYSGDTSNSKHNRFYASVYCYVSSNFDGSWVRIAAEGKVSGKFFCPYDLSRKDEWQKLEIDFYHDNGLAPVHLYMSKAGDKDFNSLNGYVIFAYPEYRKFLTSDTNSIVQVKTSYNNCIQYSSFLNSKVLLSFISLSKSFRNRNISSPDSIRQDSFVLKNGGELSIPRGERMRYSFYIFFDKYSLFQKIFGGGFNYMKDFGKKFGFVDFDYPHNPFISSFLYSGIVGGISYLYFIIMVVFYYIRYLKYHIYFFVCFIVVFFFSFVSANNHFSIPVFTFLSLIPFLTRYIVEKDNFLNSENNSESGDYKFKT
jgi:hypothetical protein